MTRYIKLDALIAEIRKRLLPVIRDKHYDEWEEGQNSERIAILGILNTLEVQSLWHDAQGTDLPEIDREVVVFIQKRPGGFMQTAVAHRPNPNGWDGKDIFTGKKRHHTPVTYGEGGWNVPDVKFWLDVELPNPYGEE